jgi:cystathionine beta-lyase
LRKPGFETLCAHAGEGAPGYAGAISPPIFQSSIFASPTAESFIGIGESPEPGYGYTRIANPTTDILEAKLAALERTEAARCFGSGMAAITASILHCVSTGDHLIAVETMYGPARAFLDGYLNRFGVSVTYVPGTNPQQFVDALQRNTRLIYLESPSTWVFYIQDLGAIASLARERGITTVIDNSWASPYFQNPADFGIDLVLHSATKYLAGHSDLVAGCVMGSREHLTSIKAMEGSLLGGILDPFGSWLMLRGIRTLGVRLDRHQSSAMTVARFLEEHPRVEKVYYPGLPSHPQYELGRKQMRGCSGLLSFSLKDGTREAACRFVNALQYFAIACSWGGYESLAIPITYPADAKGHIRWGSRLHIGLESVEDLLEDIDEGLKHV